MLNRNSVCVDSVKSASFGVNNKVETASQSPYKMILIKTVWAMHNNRNYYFICKQNSL